MDIGRFAANQYSPGSGDTLKQITNILGLGSYQTVQSNSILASPVPSVNAVVDRGIRIKNHEYIRDVSSSIAFDLLSFGINPGLKGTFPWLADIAASFQKWEPNGIVFFYKGTSAHALNSTNTALGTITGAVQYNVAEGVPPNKTSIVNLAGSMSGPPNHDNIYVVECAPSMRLMKNLLIRRNTAEEEKQKYDLGALYLASVGSQAAAITGELHVCYDITLKQPIQAGSEGNDLLSAHYYDAASAGDGTHPLGTNPTERVDGLGVTFRDTAGGTAYDQIVINPGQTGVFRFEITWKGTAPGGGGIVCPLFTPTNMTVVNCLDKATVHSIACPEDTVDAAQLSAILHYRITDPCEEAVLLVGKAGTTPTTSDVDISVTCVNSSV
jgi:hypothetical protein